MIVNVNHPAAFTPIIADTITNIVRADADGWDEYTVLDPFAGIGTIHDMFGSDLHIDTIGVELEPEWASAKNGTIVGDATNLPLPISSVDCVATSPCYGNRMADLYDGRDGSRRHTYRLSLGRVPSNGSAAGMQWGTEYRALHINAWVEARRVLKPGGLMVVNVSNHIRKGQVQRVVEWHLLTFLSLHFNIETVTQVETPRIRHGANHDLRVPTEHIMVLRRGV